jgi:hypothetical protein
MSSAILEQIRIDTLRGRFRRGITPENTFVLLRDNNSQYILCCNPIPKGTSTYEIPRECDLVTGFTSKGGCEFDVVLGNTPDKPENDGTFHVSLKPGEFVLALENVDVIPMIRNIYFRLFLTNIVGDVEVIEAFMDDQYRIEYVREDTIWHGNGWASGSGFLGRVEESKR